MISTELFVLMKLFIDSGVSWWWIAVFVVSDGMMWAGLRRALK